jgi:hypothetical protein
VQIGVITNYATEWAFLKRVMSKFKRLFIVKDLTVAELIEINKIFLQMFQE